MTFSIASSDCHTSCHFADFGWSLKNILPHVALVLHTLRIFRIRRQTIKPSKNICFGFPQTKCDQSHRKTFSFFPLWPLQKCLRITQRKMRQIQRAYNVSCETSEHVFLPHVDHKAGCVEKFYSQVFSYPFKNKFNLLTYAFCFLAKKSRD